MRVLELEAGMEKMTLTAVAPVYEYDGDRCQEVPERVCATSDKIRKRHLFAAHLLIPMQLLGATSSSRMPNQLS